MAAKNLKEAIDAAKIDRAIKEIVCVGPLSEVALRIDERVPEIKQKLTNELRDFFAHQAMRFTKHLSDAETNAVNEFFYSVFARTSAFKSSEDDSDEGYNSP